MSNPPSRPQVRRVASSVAAGRFRAGTGLTCTMITRVSLEPS